MSLVEGLQNPCTRQCVTSSANALHAGDTDINAQHDAAFVSAGLSTAKCDSESADL